MNKFNRTLPQIINFSAGLLLFVLGLMGYFNPEWFFTEKYDIVTPTAQSRTILRVMMGFMTTVGAFWLYAFFVVNQQRLLRLTAGLTIGFILSRVGGLFLDGWNQEFTYLELGFEILALIFIGIALRFNKPPLS